MRLGDKQKLRTALAALVIVVFAAELQSARPLLWVDFDMKSIDEPAKRETNDASFFLSSLLAEPIKRRFDIPLQVRTVSGRKKPAANVNAVDEVPSSSWYTIRHHLRPMTTEELARGPNRGNGPDFSHAVILQAKSAGVTPGLLLQDKTGQAYLIKFDRVGYPELLSSAEMVSTKILYAAGYNVPENYIAYIDPAQVDIPEHLQIVDSSGQKRDFTERDLGRILEQGVKEPDGRYRVLASKILAGKPVGPFAPGGIRRDDPNDLIPHEHRRELRGLRVLASWLNHWDLKESNTLDMYVEEGGRRFLRHYLIDFGSTLGSGNDPLETIHGREYIFDYSHLAKKFLTFGLYPTADEAKPNLISPSIGPFSARHFNPEEWKPSAPLMAFENMTTEDAFWGTRIVLSFSESDLRAIVDTAQYSNPGDRDYLLKTLIERQRILARHWLDKVNPLAQFSVKTGDRTVTLAFRDLAFNGDSKVGEPQYAYRVAANRHTSPKKISHGPNIEIEPEGWDSGRDDSAMTIEVAIWPAAGNDSGPTRVTLHRPASSKTFRIDGIRRG